MGVGVVAELAGRRCPESPIQELMMSKFISAVSFAVLLGVLLRPGPARGQEKLSQPLPKNIVAAWEKAGAKTAWIGSLRQNTFFNFAKEPKAGEIPVLFFEKWQPGQLEKLPVPAQPFGLDLRGAEKATD